MIRRFAPLVANRKLLGYRGRVSPAPLRWMKSGNGLFVGQRGETSCPVWRLDLQTGTRTPWKTVSPADVAGVTGVSCPRLAADEQHYVFGYVRDLSDLFLVEHLR